MFQSKPRIGERLKSADMGYFMVPVIGEVVSCELEPGYGWIVTVRNDADGKLYSAQYSAFEFAS